jgi:hypothetical protein
MDHGLEYGENDRCVHGERGQTRQEVLREEEGHWQERREDGVFTK